MPSLKFSLSVKSWIFIGVGALVVLIILACIIRKCKARRQRNKALATHKELKNETKAEIAVEEARIEKQKTIIEDVINQHHARKSMAVAQMAMNARASMYNPYANAAPAQHTVVTNPYAAGNANPYSTNPANANPYAFGVSNPVPQVQAPVFAAASAPAVPQYVQQGGSIPIGKPSDFHGAQW